MKQILLFVAFLGFFVLVTSDKNCPLAELLAPCKCSGEFYPIVYVCNNVTEQDTINNAFKNSLDFPVDALIMSNSSILFLPISLLKSKNISYLTISESKMAALFDKPPSPKNKLENIIVHHTFFQRGVDWCLFENTSPKIMQFEQVELRRIGANFVQCIKPSLWSLTLLKTRTHSFHPKAFSKLTQLSSFECSYSKIRVLKRSMFSNPSQLTTMDFTSNDIHTLPDDMFTNMPNLRTVYFNKNKMTTFTSTIWGKVYTTSLEEIYLTENPFVCDCSIIWFKKINKSVRIKGECEEPKNLKGRWLTDLSLGDFSYCPKAPSLE